MLEADAEAATFIAQAVAAGAKVVVDDSQPTIPIAAVATVATAAYDGPIHQGPTAAMPAALAPTAEARAAETSTDEIRTAEDRAVDQRSTGERFGKYEIEGRVGQGGFGVVYKGRDPVLKRTVAIKTCSTLDESLRQRFFREGQIAAGLQHPNITTVHDLGVEGGVPYLVQEFLENVDLDELIEPGELSPTTKIDILLQIARGLEFAHQAGVLHRDVKPANIRVLPSGAVKIMDFGIAKLISTDTPLTATGMTLGTVGYLAPEQLRSEQLDERADVFAFGVLAYELLTNERPFRGNDFSQVSYQLLYVDPSPVQDLLPDCPEPLGAIVLRCLEKERVRRYPDFSRVIADREALDEQLRPGSRPAFVLPTLDTEATVDEGSAAASPGRRRWLVAAAALAVVLILALGARWKAGRAVGEAGPSANGSTLAEAAPPQEAATSRPAEPDPEALKPAAEGEIDGATVVVDEPPSSGSVSTVPSSGPEKPPPAEKTAAPAAPPQDPPAAAGIGRQDADESSLRVAELAELTVTLPKAVEKEPTPGAAIPLSVDPGGSQSVEPQSDDPTKRKPSIEPAPPAAEPPAARPTMQRGDFIVPGPGVVPPRLIE